MMDRKAYFNSMTKSRKISSAISYTLLILLSIIMLIPFIWLVRSSLMEPRQIFIFPPEWIPKPVMWSNYSKALTVEPFGLYFKNTLVIVVFSMIGTIITSTLASYSFARLNWRGKKIMFYLLLSTMMLPYAVTIIPSFMLWNWLGYVDTPIPLIIPSWLGGGAFNIFLLRQFFLTIPKELDEAAIIDGANYGQILVKILFPLIKPALAVISIFTFMGTWNDFLGPLIYLSDSKKYTLAIGLAQFKGNYAAQWNYLMAASTVVILPIIVLFFLCQKYFVQGITLTGMKN